MCVGASIATMQTDSRENHALARYFDDHADCAMVCKRPDKIILRAPGQGPKEDDLFVKIYLYPRLWHRLGAWAKRMGSGHDMRICRSLQSRAISIPEPVGMVEQRSRLGLPVRSLYAAKWLRGAENLSNLLRQIHLKRTGPTEQLDHLSLTLGHSVAQMHQKGVMAKDLNNMYGLCAVFLCEGA